MKVQYVVDIEAWPSFVGSIAENNSDSTCLDVVVEQIKKGNLDFQYKGYNCELYFMYVEVSPKDDNLLIVKISGRIK